MDFCQEEETSRVIEDGGSDHNQLNFESKTKDGNFKSEETFDLSGTICPLEKKLSSTSGKGIRNENIKCCFQFKFYNL